MRTEVDRMPHILWLGKYLSHHKAAPVVRMRKVLFGFPCPTPLPRLINSRRFYLFVMEDTSDVIRAFAFNGKLEDAPHYRRRLFVNNPVVFIRRVFHIAIDGAVGGGLAGLALDPDGGALLAAQIP